MKMPHILTNIRSLIILNILFGSAAAFIIYPLEDRVMGGQLRWIALHAAFTQAVLALLLLISFIAFVSWFRNREQLIFTLKTFMAAVTLAWALNYLLMLYVTRMSWGGFDWQEPRMVNSTQLLFILALWLGLNLLIGYDWLLRYTSLAIGIFAQFLIRLAPAVNHPLDPVGSSDSPLLAFRFSALAVLATVILIYDSAYINEKLAGRFTHGGS